LRTVRGLWIGELGALVRAPVTSILIVFKMTPQPPN